METVVLSSTSSSSERLPRYGDFVALLVGLFLGLAVVLAVEMRLRQVGLCPDVHDTKELWAAERARASALGDRALVLVGDSQIQVDVDLETLAGETGLVPVQLAINGSQYLPVLADLADDPQITGTVVLGAEVWKLLPTNKRDSASEWVEFYRNNFQGLWAPALEARLKGRVQSWSALYASGIPWDRLWPLLTDNRENMFWSYLTIRPNRQYDANYRLVKQPDAYMARVMRDLGQGFNIPPPSTMAQFVASVRRILNSKPAGLPMDPEQFGYVNSLINQIMARGGKVMVVRFPSFGLIWEIDEHRHPRKNTWDRFAVATRARTIHFGDYPDLQYKLPDGSHLDVSNKVEFTKALAGVLMGNVSTSVFGHQR
jgi:hypothetical protein